LITPKSILFLTFTALELATCISVSNVADYDAFAVGPWVSLLM